MNPILNLHTYVFQNNDGTAETLKYEKVSKDLYSQFYKAGNQIHNYDGIIVYHKRKGVADKIIHLYDKNTHIYKNKVTAGWDLEVGGNNGTTSWIALK